jgi:hypothetical protein
VQRVTSGRESLELSVQVHSSSNKDVTLSLSLSLKSQGRLLIARNAFLLVRSGRMHRAQCVGYVPQGYVPLSFDEGPCHAMQHDVIHDKCLTQKGIALCVGGQQIEDVPSFF